ncbi:MAG: hypothetical protein OHK0037_03530 [Elainellaceae cyanobacterium]
MHTETPFRLDYQNVFDYLVRRNICDRQLESVISIEAKSSKNFNLLVHLTGDRLLLVKQEPLDAQGNAAGDLLIEGEVQSLFQAHSELSSLIPLTAGILLFDPAHHILVMNYLQDYLDLETFYAERQMFPTAIATGLGCLAAQFHRTTLDYWPIYHQLHPDEQAMHQIALRQFAQTAAMAEDDITAIVPNFEDGLEWLTPEDLGRISEDGQQFFELYFQSAELRRAIAHLSEIYDPCCLTHQDLKFGNVLLHRNWSRLTKPGFHAHSPHAQSADADPSMLRLIDWEKAEWGDPALDVGFLIACYLRLWLQSLVVSGLDLTEALRLAAVPLEALQPSLRSLVRGYAAAFPEMGRSPDFWQRAMQFAGYSLVRTLRVKALHFEPLGNVGICTMQVANSLLNRPEASIRSIFGGPLQGWLDSKASDPELGNQPDSQSDLAAASGPGELAGSPATVPNATPTLKLPPGAGLDDLLRHLHISPEGRIYHDRCPTAVLVEDDRPFDQLPPDMQRSYLRLQLRNVIYDLYFCGRQLTDQPAATDLRNSVQAGVDVEFFEQLSAANTGQGYFDAGWIVTQIDETTALVQRNGLILRLERDRHLLPSQRHPAVGDAVAVWMPPHRMDASFYTVLGDRGPISPDLPALQVYFNLSPAGAIALMHDLIPALNTAVLPFALSLLHDPADYDRRDSAILRICQTDWDAAAPALQQAYKTVRSHLRRAVPLFAKSLAPGVGLAEEPTDEPEHGTAIEFGLHRAQWVADALLESADPATRLAAIARQFQQTGLLLHKPYLNPGTGDRYRL